jgi:hypothetical protein
MERIQEAKAGFRSLIHQNRLLQLAREGAATTPQHICKLHHSSQILVREASAKLAHQLSRQCSDNLLPVGGSLVSENLAKDSIPDPPIECREPDVDGRGRLPASIFNQAPDLVE